MLIPPAAEAGLSDSHPNIPSIPTYPQHGPVVSARALGLGNITGIGLNAAYQAYDNPAFLTQPGITQLGADASGQWSSEGNTDFQPSALGVLLPLNPWLAFGGMYLRQSVVQDSPQIRYRDTMDKTGITSSNYIYNRIHSSGGRSWYLTGLAAALGNNFSLGITTGYVDGTIRKHASLYQYNSSNFNTQLGAYSQYDERQYHVLPFILGLRWKIFDKTSLGLRFYTPVNDTAHVQKTVYGTSGLMSQTPMELDGGHVFAHDAETGIALQQYWSSRQMTVFSFEFHDNVFFGGSAWENWELRFGHECDLGGLKLRVGGHYALPYWDAGNKPMIDPAINYDANSWGVTGGVGFCLFAKTDLDLGIAYRQIGFSQQTYEHIQLALGIRQQF